MCILLFFAENIAKEGKRMKPIRCSIIMLLIYAACSHISQPLLQTIGLSPNSQAAAQAGITEINSDDFKIHYYLKGSSIYAEVYMKNYSFSASGEKKQAEVAVYIDEKKVRDMKTAAFIIKDIPSGKHKIKMEVVDMAHLSTGLSKEFFVHIHSSI
jgi:hypothetical protein